MAKIDQVRKWSPEARFLYWVNERYQILLRRRAGLPPPWTDDEILQSCYFCNVYREDDKVTTWLRDTVRANMADDPMIIFATIAFRWFNWIPTGKILWEKGLLQRWDNGLAKQVLTAEQDKGYKVFTGAYNITAGGKSGPKLDTVCDDYVQPVWQMMDSIIDEWRTAGYERKLSLASAFELLSDLPGLGGTGFYAGQVVADLKYTKFLSHEMCSDWWTWSTPGPGSKKGLNILLSQPLEANVTKDWHKHINYYLELVNTKLTRLPPMHAQDLQSCLCEYHKMNHVLMDEGRPKRRYKGY